VESVATVGNSADRRVAMAKIARIQVIEEHEATGALKTYYEEMIHRRGRIPNIRKALSLKPEAMRAAELPGDAVTRGASRLGRAMEEQIATVVSAVNRCQY
jgi:alkylhydroperoxidase family enzyme